MCGAKTHTATHTKKWLLMSILLWTQRQRGNHLIECFFSLLFACFCFLDLTPSFILFTSSILCFSLSLSHCVSLSGCDSVNIRCRECNQNDLSLYRDPLTAERQKLSFFFSLHLSLWRETYISHIRKHAQFTPKRTRQVRRRGMLPCRARYVLSDA